MDPESGMVPLGYGTFVRADRIIAVVPIEKSERGHGRRTYVYVDGVPGPLVGSRSEGAIVADVRRALPFVGRPVEETPPEEARPADDRLRTLLGRGRRSTRR